MMRSLSDFVSCRLTTHSSTGAGGYTGTIRANSVIVRGPTDLVSFKCSSHSSAGSRNTYVITLHPPGRARHLQTVCSDCMLIVYRCSPLPLLPRPAVIRV